MLNLFSELSNIENNKSVNKDQIINNIKDIIKNSNYSVIEMDDQKPWGAYFKFHNNLADEFVEEFFPEISLKQAKLGNDDAELSPKILLVSPEQRLSWQYHERRAERWRFLTDGAYHNSLNDDECEKKLAKTNDSVQFMPLERHRLVGDNNFYTIVAEIWQHTDPNALSNEADNFRVQDDYNR